MDKKTAVRLLTDEFVEQHTVEDWGKNPNHGWAARVLFVDGESVVAMRPPNGKIWRAEMTIKEEATHD